MSLGGGWGVLDETGSALDWDIHTSQILEALFGMRSLLAGWQTGGWEDEARAALGADFMKDLKATFGPFRDGVDLFETAIAVAPTAEVEDFVDRVRAMDVDEFLYYIHGRIVPRGVDIDAIEGTVLRDYFEHYGDYEHYAGRLGEGHGDLPVGSWAAYGPILRDTLARLAQDFWRGYLRQRWPELLDRARQSADLNRAYGRAHGPVALRAMISDHPRLPPMVPEGTPVRRLVFYPVVHSASWCSTYVYGGIVDCVYRADLVPDRIEQLRRKERSSLAVAKALGDPTRLRMLKLVAMYDGALNGKDLAGKLGLAKSVVSKHVRQLIDAGLVREERPDNRNAVYFAVRPTVLGFSDDLAEVLGAPPGS